MKKIVMVIALILWGLFFYTQLKADDGTTSSGRHLGLAQDIVSDEWLTLLPPMLK